jgi:hypothetical protein
MNIREYEVPGVQLFMKLSLKASSKPGTVPLRRRG